MSIELLPFSAFALESCAAPAAEAGEGYTLTVALRVARRAEPMTGQLSMQSFDVAPAGTERVAVARLDAAPLTISFR
jgi:hypothetical protein